MKKYGVEFIGTYFLVFVILMSANPAAIGATLVALVYMGYSVSGAQYNPVVSLSIFLLKRMSIADFVFYVSAQLLAATAAALTYYAITGNIYSPVPYHGMNILKPLFSEAAFTFLLVFVILQVAFSPKTKGNDYYGLAIGCTVMGIASAGGALSGGVYNPAAGTGPILVELMFGNSAAIHNLWLYLAGPLIGSIAATVTYRIINTDEFK